MEEKTMTVERYPFFDFEVREANKTYSMGWELPKKTEVVKGIQITSGFFDKLFLRGSQKIEIGGDTIFDEGYLTRPFMSSDKVGCMSRFFHVKQVPPGDLSFKFRFTDNEHPSAPFGDGYDIYIKLITDERIR